jgi:hypothetical protein
MIFKASVWSVLDKTILQELKKEFEFPVGDRDVNTHGSAS